jgi:hypothetical protein
LKRIAYARHFLCCIFGLFVLSGCDESSVASTANDANISMRIPSIVTRAVDPARVAIEVLVDGQEITMTKGDDHFRGSIVLPVGSAPLVAVTWFENYENRQLPLAQYEQTMSALGFDTVLAIEESEYDSDSLDADNDTISNLDERRNNSDPYDPDSPGNSSGSNTQPSDENAGNDPQEEPDTDGVIDSEPDITIDQIPVSVNFNQDFYASGSWSSATDAMKVYMEIRVVKSGSDLNNLQPVDTIRIRLEDIKDRWKNVLKMDGDHAPSGAGTVGPFQLLTGALTVDGVPLENFEYLAMFMRINVQRPWRRVKDIVEGPIENIAYGNANGGSAGEDTSEMQDSISPNPGPILSQEHYNAVTSRFVPPHGYTKVAQYKFGTAPGNNIRNLTDLSRGFVSYYGELGTGGLFANPNEMTRFEHIFSPDLHVFTENSIRLLARPGVNQALDGSGNVAQPSAKYTDGQWMRGAAMRVKDKFHKNAIFMVRAKFPALTPGIFPAAWVVGGYTFWLPEVDIFESWISNDPNHPMMQTKRGHNRGDTVEYDNNWVVYQNEHRAWRNNGNGQRGHVIGRTDNWGNWVDLDAYEDHYGQWHKLPSAPDEVGIDHYTTSQVRVGGLDFTSTWVDHAVGILDDPDDNDPSKGIATWWLGGSKSRETHYWLNNDRYGAEGFPWLENDILSLQMNMTINQDAGKPDSFPQWLEIQEIVVYEPAHVAFTRNPLEPVNDARVSFAAKYVSENQETTIKIQWRNVQAGNSIVVFWADFWEKTSTDNGASWANQELDSFTPSTASGEKTITFTITKRMLESGGDTALSFDDSNREHGYMTAVIDSSETRGNSALGIPKGMFAKSLIIQDGVFYGTSSENLLKPVERY